MPELSAPSRERLQIEAEDVSNPLKPRFWVRFFGSGDLGQTARQVLARNRSLCPHLIARWIQTMTRFEVGQSGPSSPKAPTRTLLAAIADAKGFLTTGVFPESFVAARKRFPTPRPAAAATAAAAAPATATTTVVSDDDAPAAESAAKSARKHATESAGKPSKGHARAPSGKDASSGKKKAGAGDAASTSKPAASASASSASGPASSSAKETPRERRTRVLRRLGLIPPDPRDL